MNLFQFNTETIKRPLITGLTALIVGACSSGSDFGVSNNNTPNIAGAVGGGAVKGALINGLVTATLPNGTVLGTAVTDADGNYSLNLSNYTGGPVRITVAAREAGDPAGVTTMVCDIDLPGADDCGPGVSFGNTFTLPAPFTMETLLPSAAGSVEAPLTPITTLAARRAQERVDENVDGDLATAITNGYSEVSVLLGGIDIRREQAVDFTRVGRGRRTRTETTYSAVVAGVLRRAVAERANAADPVDLNAAIENLANDFDNGVISGNALNELATDARDHLTSVGENDETGALTTMENRATEANNGDGTFDPEANEQAGSDAIERAKSLVSEIRTLVRSNQDLDFDFDSLEQELGEDETIIRNAADSGAFDVFGQALNEGISFFQENGPGQTNFGDATITGSQSEDLITITVVGDLNDSASANLSARIEDVNGDGTEMVADLSGEFSVDVNSRTTQGADTISFSIDDATLVADLDEGFDPNDPNAPPVASDVRRLRFDLGGTLTVDPADRDDPSAQSASLGLTFIRCDGCSSTSQPEQEEGVVNPVNLSRLALSFSSGLGDNQVITSFRIEANEDSAASFDPNAPTTSDNFLEVTLTLSGQLALDEQPDRQATLAVSVTGFDDATEAPVGEATLTLSQASSVIRISTASTTENPDRVDRVTINSSSGITIELVNVTPDGEDVEFAGQILVGDEVIANISDSNGVVIIRYADGSFESLA